MDQGRDEDTGTKSVAIRACGRHSATSRKVANSNPDEFIGFFNLLIHSSSTMVLGSTHPLAKMSTRNLNGGKGWPARKAHNLTADCLTTLWAFTTCCTDSFASNDFCFKKSLTFKKMLHNKIMDKFMRNNHHVSETENRMLMGLQSRRDSSKF
jgi:hypothetical protein